MPQSVAKVAIHIVFSTKHRKPWMRTPELQQELFAYMAAILKRQVDSPALMVGGVEDHVHALCLLSRKFPIMKVIEKAKTETSKWIKKQPLVASNFAWQGGYGAFSVSESNIPQVKKYIQDQAIHHQRMSFQDEFRQLCERHGVKLDEQYAWN